MSSMSTVSANLRLIEEMALRLEARAVDRASARDIPGGDAMVNLASVGSMTDNLRRYEIAEQWHLDDPDRHPDTTVDLEHEDPDDLWPAVQLLWFRSEKYREQLGHNYDDPRWRPDLVSEAKFLRNHDVAEWIWNNDPQWDAYAADVARAKTQLENILIEGERSERTAVVCNLCDDGRRLIRVYADREHVADECGECGALYDPDSIDDCPIDGTMLQPVYNSDPADDRWKCPGCKHKHSLDDLDKARAAQMRRSEPRAWIQRPEAVSLLRSLGHQERVAVRLIDDPECLGHCDLVTHVRWVSWPEVWRRHLSVMQDRRMKAEQATRRTPLTA